MLRWIVLFGLFISSASQAASFWDRHSVGWHWYHDPKIIQSESDVISKDPIKQMQTLQRQIQQTLYQAILNPTPEHVKAYVEMQNKITAQASLFSDVWKRTLLSIPELDYSLEHPTNQTARQMYLDNERKKMESALYAIAQTTGLFFFFKESCPYCHQMAPLVKSFARQYGFSVIAISMDGGLLSEFQEAKRNQSVAAQLHVTTVPALFTVEPKTQRILPIASGVISADELMQRIYLSAGQQR